MERDSFREAVFARDGHLCARCKELAVDAHHLLERRLWSDGGYHLDNGVSLCAACHLLAEQTLISVEELREMAGIKKIVLPDSLEWGNVYDKWGNIVLPNGRIRGPLFYDESVQKVLRQGDVLRYFTRYVKYPRTPHLPWSMGRSDGDIVGRSDWTRERVVITEKMDGENTTLYNDRVHSRSLDTAYHWSRTWVKNFHAKIGFDIPENMRICGENLQATHSIKYINLSSFFMGYSVWRDDLCLSWRETAEWFELLGITPVPVLAKGKWESDDVQGFIDSWRDGNEREGYVVRLEGSFHFSQFNQSVAKYVRRGHVQTRRHWLKGSTEKNLLLT
jgi:hypothetical protein